MTHQGIYRDPEAASGLVGAHIGSLSVVSKFHTGKRWQYSVLDRATGKTGVMRGYQIVRAARAARGSGLAVVMPGAPWCDDDPHPMDLR